MRGYPVFTFLIPLMAATCVVVYDPRACSVADGGCIASFEGAIAPNSASEV